MRSILSPLLLLLLLTGLIGMYWLQIRTDIPARVVAEETVWDFGEIGPRRVSHQFVIRNGGGASLILQKPLFTCDCMQVYLADTEVAPGASTTLEIVLDPQAAMVTPVGHIERQVYIRSNDKDQPEVEYTILANIQPIW